MGKTRGKKTAGDQRHHVPWPDLLVAALWLDLRLGVQCDYLRARETGSSAREWP